MTQARLRRDLRWPIPPAELQDLDVLEILRGTDGQVLWRCDGRPAAAPDAYRELLMKRHRRAAPVALIALTPITQLIAEALERSQLPQQEQEFEAERAGSIGPQLGAAEAEIPQAPEATPRPAEPLQVVEPPVTLAPVEPSVMLATTEVAQRPDGSGVIEPPQLLHPLALREEEVASTELLAVPDLREMPDVPMVNQAPVPVLDVPAPMPLPAPKNQRAARRASVRLWMASAALARPRIGNGERVGLVCAGMLIGVAFTILGVSRGAVTSDAPVPVAAPHTVAALDIEPAAPASSATTPAAAGAMPAAASRDGTTSTATAAPAAVAPALTPTAPPAPPTANALQPAPLPGPSASATPGPTLARAAHAPTRPAERRSASTASRTARQPAPAVLGAINKYAVAYNRLDARATAAVWPSADHQSLVRTFTGLREQRLTLSACTTAVAGDRATASCRGERRYRPRVGDHSTRVQQGRWRFDLQRASGVWLIATVNAPS